MVESLLTDEQSREQWRKRALFQLATESRISFAAIQSASEIGWADGADKLVERGYVILDTSDTATARLRELVEDEEASIISLSPAFDVADRAEAEGVWTPESQTMKTHDG